MDTVTQIITGMLPEKTLISDLIQGPYWEGGQRDGARINEAIIIASQLLLGLAKVNDKHPFQTCVICLGPVCMGDVTGGGYTCNACLEIGQ